MPRTVYRLQDLKALKAHLDGQAALRKAQQLAQERERQRIQAEHAFFVHAVGKVRPLRPDGRVQLSQPPVPPIPQQRYNDHAAVLQESISDCIDISSLLDTDEDLSYCQPGIGPDVVCKLRRGHWSIQTELDLHGLRRDDARNALGAFIRTCQQRGLRCVRIITGKGLGSPGRQPVLKNRTYGWLMQKREVLAFVQARPAEGGAGALVVLLTPA